MYSKLSLLLLCALPRRIEAWAPLIVPKSEIQQASTPQFGTFVPPKDAVWVLATPLTHTITYEPLVQESTTMDRIDSIEQVHPSLKKMLFISLHSQSLTRAAFMDSKVGILHCLSPNQVESVGKCLSKRAGYHNDFHYSKREQCAEKGLIWQPYIDCCEKTDCMNEDDDELLTDEEIIHMEDILAEMDILPRADAYLKVKLMKHIPAGDHDISFCEVVGFGQWDEACDRVVMKHNLHLTPSSLMP